MCVGKVCIFGQLKVNCKVYDHEKKDIASDEFTTMIY